MLLGKGESSGLLAAQERLGRKRTQAGERTPVACCGWVVFVVFVGVGCFFFCLASWYSEVILKFNESLMLK